MALNTLKCNHLMPLPYKGLRSSSSSSSSSGSCASGEVVDSVMNQLRDVRRF